MLDRRNDDRMLCADLVDVRWKDKAGRRKRCVANLEDISMTGACLQTEMVVPANTVVTISYPKGELSGRVKYCSYRDIGYFVGVEFEEGVQWTQRQFKPQHLLDPRRLMLRVSRAVRPGKQPSPEH